MSFDAQGLIVSRNTIIATNDNGIEILRTAIGDDGTLVLDNRIEDIKAGPGGSGQYGNAINAFRAGNVIVRGNRIRNCDYSAVRGNSASNIQIIGNSVSDVREVALYSEFSFEGAVIAGNTVDGAAIGVSVCNFNEGGRLAVVQGNIIRNLLAKRPIGTAPDDDAGIGIYVEADTSVTGNVIENAPSFGIVAGWGKYLRDVAITGNVIRNAFAGIGVSVRAGRRHRARQQQHDLGDAARRRGRARSCAGRSRRICQLEGAQRFAQVVVGTQRGAALIRKRRAEQRVAEQRDSAPRSPSSSSRLLHRGGRRHRALVPARHLVGRRSRASRRRLGGGSSHGGSTWID